MKNFFYNLGQSFRQLMVGRNGPDQCGNFFAIVAMLLFLLSFFLKRVPYAYILVDGLATAAMIYSIFRMFSKNIPARQAENMRFMDMAGHQAEKRAHRRKVADQKKLYGKTHKFLECPNCGHTLRIPKDQGKVKVTCPNCHTKFDAKS